MHLRTIGPVRKSRPCGTWRRQLGGQVEFTGYLKGYGAAGSDTPARAVAIPSEWNENAPLSVMEASAPSCPIIGADIGGVPELIRPGETGSVFKSGQVDSGIGSGSGCSGFRRRLGAPWRGGLGSDRAEFSPAAYRERMSARY